MEIFSDNFDRERFQNLLYLVNSKQTVKYSDLESKKFNSEMVWLLERGETLVNIGAYSLMPNHFHLLIQSKNEKDTAIFIKRLLISHSKYFNKKYDRSGSLFQGKSKSQHITNDRYLKYIFSYIHLNIIKLIQKDWKETGISDINIALEYLSKYKYSSYLDFSEIERIESKILEKTAFPNYYLSSDSFKKEIFEWLNYNTNEKI